MDHPRQITAIQVATILASTNIGVGILHLPVLAVRGAGTGAPLVTLLGTFIACIGLWVITRLGIRFPNLSIVQYSQDVIGKWLAWVGGVLVVFFFAILTSLTAREFGEVMGSFILSKTPLEITVIVMLLLTAISTRVSITTFAYIHYFYFPIILAPALLIIVLSLKNAEVINLLPILSGNKPGIILSDGFPIAGLFQGTFIMTAVIPAMRRPERAMSAGLWGMLIAGGIYLMIVVATVAVFGVEYTKLALWPTLELARLTALPANIMERLDALFLIVWVTAVFTTLLSTYFLTVHCMSNLFRLRDHRFFSLFVLPFTFFTAMLPQNILQLYDFIEMVSLIGLYITIAYPGLLLLIAVIRKKRGGRHAG